jgi:hypothetical protein
MANRWNFRYKEPPPTLVVLYQEKPIAELEEKKDGFMFRYLPAFAEMKLSSFPGLPTGKGELFFYSLPTYFEERLPDVKRPEIREWLRLHNASEYSKLRLLAELGTHTITDPFEFRLKAAA